MNVKRKMISSFPPRQTGTNDGKHIRDTILRLQFQRKIVWWWSYEYNPTAKNTGQEAISSDHHHVWTTHSSNCNFFSLIPVLTAAAASSAVVAHLNQCLTQFDPTASLCFPYEFNWICEDLQHFLEMKCKWCWFACSALLMLFLLLLLLLHFFLSFFLWLAFTTYELKYHIQSFSTWVSILVLFHPLTSSSPFLCIF